MFVGPGWRRLVGRSGFAHRHCMMLLALDHVPRRHTFDRDGRLRAANARLSRATVNRYRGDELPQWEKLGLDAQREYNLLRHPDELARAARSFSGLPLLAQHPVDERGLDLVVGAIGDNVCYRDGYLVGDAAIWGKDAIEAVVSRKRPALSCGHRYDVDMTPGVFQGEHYDAVMRNLVGQHVALAVFGRAGPQCEL
jgi:uncharacterized protein